MSYPLFVFASTPPESTHRVPFFSPYYISCANRAMGFDSDSDESALSAGSPTSTSIRPKHHTAIGLATLDTSVLPPPTAPPTAESEVATFDRQIETIFVPDSHVNSPCEEARDCIVAIATAPPRAPLCAIPTPLGRRHDRPIPTSAAATPTADMSDGGELAPLPDILSQVIVPHDFRMPNDRDWTCAVDVETKVPLWDKESIEFWMTWFEEYICNQRLSRGGAQLEPMRCISACTGSYSPGAVAWVSMGPPKRQHTRTCIHSRLPVGGRKFARRGSCIMCGHDRLETIIQMLYFC